MNEPTKTELNRICEDICSKCYWPFKTANQEECDAVCASCRIGVDLANLFEGLAIYRNAFALACRLLEDVMDCPAADGNADWAECSGEMGACGDRDRWECWQKYFLEKASEAAACRVCGCTDDHACPGGCYWVEEDLCSRCAKRKEDHFSP